MAVRRHDPARRPLPHPPPDRPLIPFPAPSFAIAATILLASWLLLRWQVGAGLRGTSLAALPLDIGPILLGWLALLSLTARPVVAATAIAAAAAGLVLADAVKRATLREPLVFADRAELLEVVRHPRLYLPFAGPANVAAIALAAAAAIAALLWLEPPSPHPSPFLMLPLLAACFLVPTWPPLLTRLATRYRRMGITTTNDPAADMRRMGFLACLVMHATIARDERPARRAAAAPLLPAALPQATPSGAPIILIQAESFFDATRLGPPIPPDLLPAYTRLRAGAAQSGRLAVPCWGANTVRTEFAALTGIDQATLGLDGFNPYERFAQGPQAAHLPSLARSLRAAGYRTICLHPFDKSFYARATVIPLLGFDEFRGMEAFQDAEHAGPYVADRAVGRAIAAILAAEGPRVFVFAMTMGNHGPWDLPHAHPPLPPWSSALDTLPEAVGLKSYLSGLVDTDAMLPPILEALPPGGLLALYGDHQPSLPKALAALSLPDEDTDYAVWRQGSPPDALTGITQDIRAEDLPALLLRLAAPRMDKPPPLLP